MRVQFAGTRCYCAREEMQSSQFHCNLLEVKSGAEENQSMELLFIISLYSEQAVSKAQSPLSAEHCSFWVFTFFLWERGMGELLNMENAQSVLGLREMRGVLTVQRDSHERRVLNFNYPPESVCRGCRLELAGI